MNDAQITLSVLMLRKHSDLFAQHGKDPLKLYLNRMLFNSSRRTLTEKEAAKTIAGIKELRAKQ